MLMENYLPTLGLQILSRTFFDKIYRNFCLYFFLHVDT